MENSILIILVRKIEDMTFSSNESIQKIGSLSSDEYKEICEIHKFTHTLIKNSKKLTEKKEKIIRESQKFMKRVSQSRGIELSEELGIGVSLETDYVYVGERKEIEEDPTSEPKDHHIIKGKLTKSEKRKYLELIDKYRWLADTIKAHNVEVSQNEEKMKDFENIHLKEKQYTRENCAIIIEDNKNIFLYKNEKENSKV